MLVRIPNSGGGGVKTLTHSPWRMTLALAALIAVAALAVLSLSGPAAADGHGTRYGNCDECSAGSVDPLGRVGVRGLTAVQISAGSDHVYALKANGTLVGWGVSGDGRLDTPKLLVQRGNDQNDDGAPDYVGNRGLVRQEPVRWSQVAAGNLHTCAVTTEGEIYCWGDNDLKQTEIPIGLLDQWGWEIPTPRFTKIVAGADHTCVLEAETAISVTPTRAGGPNTIPAGSIVCWGDNSMGQTNVPGAPSAEYRNPLPNDRSAGLGGVAAKANGDLGSSNSSDKMYVDVTAGANHTCAVRTTGIVDCWGSNSHGQIRVPMQLRQAQSAVISPSGGLVRSGQFHSIEAGDSFTCAINREGGALCWGSNSAWQEYPPAGEYSQISAGRWHACALWTYDQPPYRAAPESPEPLWRKSGSETPPSYRSSEPNAPEPALRVTGRDGRGLVTETISLSSPPYNLDCWGKDFGSGRTMPPTSVMRRTTSGGWVKISPLRWNQVSAGGTFSCGIFDTTPEEPDPSVPSNAEQASRVSATNQVSEGAVACWGMQPATLVPAPDVIQVQPVKKKQGTSSDGWGRIYGRVSYNGTIEFAFKVVQTGPDIWIDPQFRFVPRRGSLTVDRWYYSDPMSVEVYSRALRKMCRCTDMMIGRIAVRLLKSGHMQLALMTPDGRVMANVPANHSRIPTPAELDKWWATDFIKWYDAP